MGQLHMFRNRRPEVTIIKQTVQFTLFLIVSLWLLYQIHLSLYVRRDSDCDFIDDRMIDERIVKLLGRKAGFGKSHYAEEMELYGVDLIGEAVTINNASDVDDNQVGNPNAEENDEREHLESEIVEGKKVNDSMSGNLDIEDSEIDSVVKLNAVILKSDEKYESGPSKRSNVGVESVQNGVMSKTERCQYICSKNATDREKLRSELEGEVVEIKMPEIVTVKPEKRSMRDILLSEM